MFVCICNEVTDQQIKSATETGVSCMRDLRKSLKVGTTCGHCSTSAQSLLKEFLPVPKELTQQAI